MKVISVFDKQGNKIKTYNSLSECGKELNIDISSISKSARKEGTTHGYYIRFGDKDSIELSTKKEYKRTFIDKPFLSKETNYILESGRHYLYRHVRVDTNNPFYIGIGTKPNNIKGNERDKVIYRRAYSKETRNSIWYNIVNKCDGKFIVEIILESDNYEFIQTKEKEFITLYGKKKDGGLLVNMTDGGEGTRGHPSNKYVCAKKVYVYSLEGDYLYAYNSTQEAGKSLGINRSCISIIATGNRESNGKYRFSYELKDKLEPLVPKINTQQHPNYIHPGNKKTLKIKDGIVVEVLCSTAAFCKKYAYKSSGISKAIKTGNKAYGFHWKHEETNK